MTRRRQQHEESDHESDYEDVSSENSGPENEGSENNSDNGFEVTGRRKALFVGINYDYPGSDYTEEDSLFLMDGDDASEDQLPTKENILNGMRWLAEDAQPGDQLFFHYSGRTYSFFSHARILINKRQKDGTYEDDEDGDEADGRDEALCPLDGPEVGPLLDDEIHETLAAPLPAGVRLTVVIDACHSGTVMDLPYLYDTQSGSLEINASNRKSAKARTTRADIISISGCKDSETSTDAEIDDEVTGAMSYALKRVLEENMGSDLSYSDLLIKMRRILRKGKYDQVPQLTAGRQLDMEDNFCI
ncbi:caspase domain-containing protein [Blastocladiella britannica]|nr:caspase domain-containing protein [Blastocladiella britannica]